MTEGALALNDWTSDHRHAVEIVHASALIPIVPIRRFSGAIGRGFLDAGFVEVHHVPSLCRVVGQLVPGKGIVVLAEAEEPSEGKDRVGNLSRPLADHDITDGTDLLSFSVEHRGALNLSGGDQFVRLVDGDSLFRT